MVLCSARAFHLIPLLLLVVVYMFILCVLLNCLYISLVVYVD